MTVEIRHTNDPVAQTVAVLVMKHVPSAVLVSYEPTDPAESACGIRLGARSLANIIWFRNQERSQSWIETTAIRLSKTLSDAGFGGNSASGVKQLHIDHGVNRYDAIAARIARSATKKSDREMMSEGFDPSSMGESREEGDDGE